MTAATVALIPDPATARDGASADDTSCPGPTSSPPGTSSPRPAAAPPDPAAGRIDASTWPPASSPRLRLGTAAHRVRQPPRDRLPGLLSRLQARRPPARPRRAWSAARASPRPSPPIRACSPPSPPPRSARCTPAGCAARPCCPAAPAATPTPAAARTAATSPARPPRRRRSPARPAALPATATTTTPPSCSTPTPGTCGAGSPPTCPATSPAWPGSPRNGCAPWSAIRYVKVAEYQARGVVHFHAVIRLDAPGEDYQPPPPASPPRCCATPSARPPPPSASPCPGTRPRRPADLRRAARHRRPAHPPRRRPARHRPAADRQAVANYIAKYATKTLDRARHARPAAPAPLDIDAPALLGPLHSR